MRFRSRLRFVLVLLPVLLACGDDAQSMAAASSGRGSDACRDWQDAVCDFAADECHLLHRAACDEQYQGVVCKSDDQASACSNKLNDASCGGPAVPACDIRDIADSAPAVKNCKDLLSAACEWRVGCDASVDLATCLDELDGQFGGCDGALSIELGYEVCMEQIDELECTDATLPAACSGVILVLM